MTLGPFALIVSSLASYRLARLIVTDAVFDGPRESALKWLRRGEKPWQRGVGRFLISWGKISLIYLWAQRAVNQSQGWDSWVRDNDAMAQMTALCIAMIVAGMVFGYRLFVEELIGCMWCVSVWTSAAVTLSLALWGGWPIVPSIVFGLGVAGTGCLLILLSSVVAAWVDMKDDEHWERVDQAKQLSDNVDE